MLPLCLCVLFCLGANSLIFVERFEHHSNRHHLNAVVKFFIFLLTVIQTRPLREHLRWE
jgi:hypothetical protein